MGDSVRLLACDFVRQAVASPEFASWSTSIQTALHIAAHAWQQPSGISIHSTGPCYFMNFTETWSMER